MWGMRDCSWLELALESEHYCCLETYTGIESLFPSGVYSQLRGDLLLSYKQQSLRLGGKLEVCMQLVAIYIK
jgi:hypothetical protein